MSIQLLRCNAIYIASGENVVGKAVYEKHDRIVVVHDLDVNGKINKEEAVIQLLNSLGKNADTIHIECDNLKESLLNAVRNKTAIGKIVVR